MGKKPKDLSDAISPLRTDVLSPEQRRFNMSRIRGKDTKPEKIIRSLVFKLGYRFRLHDKKIPGTPDLVFKSRKKVILVHGCFWHMHSCNKGMVKPKANASFWEEKRTRNVERDAANLEKLSDIGWEALVIWECEIKDIQLVEQKIKDYLR